MAVSILNLAKIFNIRGESCDTLSRSVCQLDGNRNMADIRHIQCKPELSSFSQCSNVMDRTDRRMVLSRLSTSTFQRQSVACEECVSSMDDCIIRSEKNILYRADRRFLFDEHVKFSRYLVYAASVVKAMCCSKADRPNDA